MRMENTTPVGRTFYAISLMAFGVEQFLFGDFIPGRAPPWPSSLPGQAVWAYATGAFLVLAGAAILARQRQRGRWAALAVGALIFLWAFLRHIPLVLADSHVGGAWTAAGKALALAGGAIAVAGSLSPGGVDARAFRTTGQICLGLFLALGGIQHFIWVDFVKTLVPTWIPGATFWTYFAAVALIAGGVGMNFAPTARLAALLSGAMIFIWFVILHVPRALVAASPASRQNEWIAVFEALAVSGIAFVLAGPPAPVERAVRSATRTSG
jgi:uncharacterized membrane protein